MSSLPNNFPDQLFVEKIIAYLKEESWPAPIDYPRDRRAHFHDIHDLELYVSPGHEDPEAKAQAEMAAEMGLSMTVFVRRRSEFSVTGTLIRWYKDVSQAEQRLKNDILIRGTVEYYRYANEDGSMYSEECTLIDPVHALHPAA